MSELIQFDQSNPFAQQMQQIQVVTAMRSLFNRDNVKPLDINALAVKQMESIDLENAERRLDIHERAKSMGIDPNVVIAKTQAQKEQELHDLKVAAFQAEEQRKQEIHIANLAQIGA